MNQQYCCYCGHFRQHYTLSDGKLVKVYCGHCTFLSPVKRKRCHDKVCDNFIPIPSNAENFVSKEYLLPEIQDTTGDTKNKDASQ